MKTLQQLFKIFAPSKISCNDAYDTELPHDQAAMDEDYSPVHNNNRRKVPGFEHLLNPIAMITGNLDFVRGFKFDVALPLSQYFQILQSWQIPNSGTQQKSNPMNPMQKAPAKPTYTFTAQVLKDIRGNEPGTIYMSKIDNEGRLDAIFIKKLASNLNLKISGHFPDSKVEKGIFGADLEYEDKDSIVISKVSQSPNGPFFSFNMMQRVHKNLMLGFDYLNFITAKKSIFSYGAKAFLGNHSFYAAYMQEAQLHLGYLIPIKKNTTFVSHYKYDKMEKKSTAIIGFKQRYDQVEITATVNSRGKLSTILSLKGPTYGLKLCALIDYMREKYSFGYGISIGQQQ